MISTRVLGSNRAVDLSTRSASVYTAPHSCRHYFDTESAASGTGRVPYTRVLVPAHFDICTAEDVDGETDVVKGTIITGKDRESTRDLGRCR